MALESVILTKPRGFCAGVDRAIDIVELALKHLRAPIYVRKEIVHNRHVVDALSRKGAIFVEELDEVPDGATVIFSAHGVSPAVRVEAKGRGLTVIDATCPLVTKVHIEAVRYAREGRTIVLVGHADHDEIIGTRGEAPANTIVISSVEEVERLEVADPDKVAYLTQTTLSLDDTRAVVEALRRRFPRIVGPASEDICYATQNRQMAVKDLARHADVILVIGASNSSNSMRLREVAEASGARAYLINDAREIRPEWLEGVRRVGVTAGASAPEYLVQEVVKECGRLGAAEAKELETITEDVRFTLPRELETLAAQAGNPIARRKSAGH
jgi:4-hydroxy-3-methylbut-2-enyl diphosphate reductase